MAELVNAKDWSATPLGPIESWPQSLKTTVSLCLASNFPINIAWGPNRVQIYNDGYWPLTGDKHPGSMGQDYKECWFSAWDVLGESFDEASKGETRFLENTRMFLDRYGYLEETFFTFSFSPIRDESGEVGGLFHPVTELTQQSLSERRLTILRELAEKTSDAETVQEACDLAIATLREFDLDLPFVLFYTQDEDGKYGQLRGQFGLDEGGPVAPETVTFDDGHAFGSVFQKVIANRKYEQVNGLKQELGEFISGPYPEAPDKALVMPIYVPGAVEPHTFMVAGVSSCRKLDEKYLIFYELLAAGLTTAYTKAKAYEEEKKRAEALAELDRAKTAFFSNISHEFRTPLTLMGPLEDTLADQGHALDQVQRERLDLVFRNTLRLQRLVNSLLDFSRIESGRLKAGFRQTDICQFTMELAGVFRSAMEKAGLSFEVDCQPGRAPVYVDHEMWEKIVFNLLSNALKFTLRAASNSISANRMVSWCCR